MGEKAIIGAIGAIIIGVSSYYIYGKKHYQFNQSLNTESSEE
jgi:hypothetical protein